MDNRKRKLNESSRSALLEDMEFSICSDIRDMVKLRNEKLRPVLKEESKEELFGRTFAFELKQLPQYEKVVAKHELRSVMFNYQMMAIWNPFTPIGSRKLPPRKIPPALILTLILNQTLTLTGGKFPDTPCPNLMLTTQISFLLLRHLTGPTSVMQKNSE